MHRTGRKGSVPADEDFRTFGVPFELMKFRLTFDGELKACGNHNRRVRDKWAIRKALEPQLRELWTEHPALQGIGLFAPRPLNMSMKMQRRVLAEPQAVVAAELKNPITVGGKRFLPLVRKSLDLACSLDITFMRKEPPGKLVLQGGDMDNRIKTLFDALSIPQAQDLIDEPLSSEPFLCLLEDDALITGQKVETDRLLTKPDAKVSEVRLVIQVTVNVMRITGSNIGFIGD